jgi:hypothetical protein
MHSSRPFYILLAGQSRACKYSRHVASTYLHPCASLLGNVMAVHDVEDLVTHSLGITTAPHGAQHGAYPLLGLPASLAVRLLKENTHFRNLILSTDASSGLPS